MAQQPSCQLPLAGHLKGRQETSRRAGFIIAMDAGVHAAKLGSETQVSGAREGACRRGRKPLAGRVSSLPAMHALYREMGGMVLRPSCQLPVRASEEEAGNLRQGRRRHHQRTTSQHMHSCAFPSVAWMARYQLPRKGASESGAGSPQQAASPHRQRTGSTTHPAQRNRAVPTRGM